MDFFQPSEKKNHQTFRSQETRPGCHVYRVSVGKRQDFPKAIFEDPVFFQDLMWFNGFNCRICRCTWTMMDYKHPVKQLHTLYAGRFQHTVQMGKHMPCNRLPTFVYQRKTNGWFIRATFTKTVLTWFFSEKKLSHFYLSSLLGTMMKLHTIRYQYRCSQRTFQDSNDSECWLTTSPCLCCLGGGKWNIPTRWQVNWAMFHIVSGPDRPQLWVKNNPSFWVFHSTDKCKVGVHGDLETNSRFWWAYRGGLMEVQWGFI